MVFVEVRTTGGLIMSEEDGPEFTVPTHRCPECGGTSMVPSRKYSASVKEEEPCPVCSKYGPFGLVPAVVAIEASLTERLGPKEKTIRARGQISSKATDWLLRDAPMKCDACDGSGYWTPNSKWARRGQKRVCFECHGRGVLR